MNNKIDDSKALTTPWTLKVFNSIPGNPTIIGLGFVVTLFTVFFAGRYVASANSESTPADFRLTIVHLLLTAYSAFAYIYLLSSAKKAARDLAPTDRRNTLAAHSVDHAGTHHWWALVLAGVVGILVQTYFTVATTTDSEPWNWSHLSYDVQWMRILGPIFSAWISCLLYVLVIESFRLSKLSENIESLDLLDLSPYRPFVRQGLTNALLVAGFASVFSIFLLEPGFGLLIIQLSLLFTVFATVGLMLPLSGIRRKISLAKSEERQWCTQQIKATRDQFKEGRQGQKTLSDILAYQQLIENIRNWPFDSPTLTRFALYLLIPFGSLLGGVIIERAVDLLLS